MNNWFQDIGTYVKDIDMHQVEDWLQQYSNLGPLPGILLPFSEAFLPFLPLVVFIMANAAAYGLWWGFLFSWIGVCGGAIIVFLLSRMLGAKFGVYIQKRLPGTQHFFHWIQEKGFTPLFLLYCFPFTPSSLINIASGISTIPFSTFIIAVMSGKSVMIFMMAFIGHDWQGFIHQPWRIILALSIFGLLWLLGKKLEKRYHHPTNPPAA